MKRRSFVGAAFAGLSAWSSSAKPKATAGDIPMRVFGKTNVKLTVIAQGGARMDLFPDMEAARKYVRHIYDLGINYFDCAHAYWGGKSEQVYGGVLPEVRKDVFITTKSMKRTRQTAGQDLEASLRSLKSDYVDLWQMHDVRTS